MNEQREPTTVSLEQEADAFERALSRTEDAWLELKAENRRLREALIPFANVARTSVVQNAISFGKVAPKLYISRAGSVEMIDPWCFVRALELS